MINKFSENQNWAKATPLMGATAAILLLILLKPSAPMFWALINIPLYLFHQTEEHYIPGGFKEYMNRRVFKLPKGKESLTDIKVFYINIILVWIAFLIFGVLAFLNMGFGLLIIIFSIINCATHIRQGIVSREWNPGLVVATIQFFVSIYAAYFVTSHGVQNSLMWWIGAIIFSMLTHIVMFKVVMSK